MSVHRRPNHQPYVQIVIVHVQVKPEFVDAFVAATEANATASRGEPGIARFDIYRQTDDPLRFVLHEVYRSPAAIAAHKDTEHYRIWRDAAGPMMAGTRARAEYVNVSPADAAW